MNSANLYQRHFKKNPDDWNAVCVALDSIGDTTYALRAYEVGGLGRGDADKYLRLYGMLQAVYLQQDAISYVYRLFVDDVIRHKDDSLWKRLREVRHLVTGHPVENRDRQTGETKRTFLTRVSIHDDGFDLIVWNRLRSDDDFLSINLKELYEGFKEEAITHLEHVAARQVDRWGPLPDV